MNQAYAKWMYEWENRLAFKSTNRVVRPFEWGEEWARAWPVAKDFPKNGHDPESYLLALNRRIMDSSEEFFSYRTPSDFRLEEGNLLKFTSAVETPYPENNIVHGQWFPPRNGRGARGSFAKKTAVIVLPHFNAQVTQHRALAAGMAKLGMAAVRISLPYHDYRMPAELERADYAVSSNIGRTLDATRQAVIDVRSVADWLSQQGYERIGLCGTSLGSCYAYLASAHDDRFHVNVFNHCSTYFADVVWEGLSTQHIRQGIESHISLERLRPLWEAVSPPAYAQKYADKNKRSLFIYALYDTTFPRHLSEQVIAGAKEWKLDHKAVALPCGHYTEGETPFKFMAGYHIVGFLKRNL
ncbi:MAG TPA: alpha/beta hydrolase family protein [Bryobacteraceae bacterium]|jgi:dienelactone hydrolase